jgi:hypothetical protein
MQKPNRSPVRALGPATSEARQGVERGGATLGQLHVTHVLTHGFVARLPGRWHPSGMANAPSDPSKLDPVLRSLESAPLDDEPVTEEEERLVEEARQELARGEGISTEELLRRLRLKL